MLTTRLSSGRKNGLLVGSTGQRGRCGSGGRRTHNSLAGLNLRLGFRRDGTTRSVELPNGGHPSSATQIWVHKMEGIGARAIPSLPEMAKRGREFKLSNSGRSAPTAASRGGYPWGAS